MTYVLRSNRDTRGSFIKPLKIILGITVVLVILHFFFPRLLPTFFTTLIRPFWNSSGTEELRQEFLKEQANWVQDNAILQENVELKELLGRSQKIHKPLLALILKKPPFSAYDTFILDVGVEHNVKKGQSVYTLGDIPIGEIAEVVGNTSKVLLYSSSGQKFTALMGKSNIEAIATGKGGGYFEVSLPRDTKITVGDSAHIPSLSDSFVGVVEAIASDPSEPFSKVLFHQPVNIYRLKWVIIHQHES